MESEITTGIISEIDGAIEVAWKAAEEAEKAERERQRKADETKERAAEDFIREHIPAGLRVDRDDNFPWTISHPKLTTVSLVMRWLIGSQVWSCERVEVEGPDGDRLIGDFSIDNIKRALARARLSYMEANGIITPKEAAQASNFLKI